MDSSFQQSNTRCAHLGGFLLALVVDESARHLVERSDDDDALLMKGISSEMPHSVKASTVRVWPPQTPCCPKPAPKLAVFHPPPRPAKADNYRDSKISSKVSCFIPPPNLEKKTFAKVWAAAGPTGWEAGRVSPGGTPAGRGRADHTTHATQPAQAAVRGRHDTCRARALTCVWMLAQQQKQIDNGRRVRTTTYMYENMM